MFRRATIGLAIWALASALVISAPLLDLAKAGRMSLLGVGLPPIAAGGGCTAATNFLARTSGLDATHVTLTTTALCGLVTDGVITGNLSGGNGCGSNLDAFYILATNSTGNAALNVCGTNFTLTTTGANLGFVADQGYTSTGDALNTNYTPSTAALNMTQNSAFYWLYDLTNANPNSGSLIGAADGPYTQIIQFDPFVGGTNPEAAINDGKSGYAATATGRGSWAVNRSGATAGTIRKNAASFDTITSTSTGLPPASIYLLALDQGGSLGNHCTDRLAFAAFGKSMSSALLDALSNRMNTYAAGLSTPINVY